MSRKKILFDINNVILPFLVVESIENKLGRESRGCIESLETFGTLDLRIP